MNEGTEVDNEIDAMCATPEQEAEIRRLEKIVEEDDAALAKTSQEIWDKQIAPCAALMLDGETYILNMPKMRYRYGMESDVYLDTDEGKEAIKLIAAGFFEKGGQLLQLAMRENALENACEYLGYDLVEIRALIKE